MEGLFSRCVDDGRGAGKLYRETLAVVVEGAVMLEHGWC